MYGAVVSAGAVYVTGAGGTGFDQVLVGGITPAGELNSAFGTGGKNSYNFSTDEDFGQAVTLDGAGRVVVVGLTANAANNNLLVARLLSP